MSTFKHSYMYIYDNNYNSLSSEHGQSTRELSQQYMYTGVFSMLAGMGACYSIL